MENFNADPFALKGNPWNSNRVNRDNFEKLKKSLDKLGSFKPVVVRQLANKDYEILAGFHRVEAAKELGWKEIPVVNLGPLSDQRAKEISLIDNARYGADDSEKLELLINSMDTELIGMVIPEVEELQIPETTDTLTDFEEKVMQSPDREEDSAKTLKFRYDDLDKADEVEDFLLVVAKENGYYFADGYANLSEALYHALIVDRK